MQALIASTNAAVDALIATARRMPEDKLTWSVMDLGRTAMDQLQECANAPDMFLPILKPGYVSKYKSYEEAGEAQKQWDTLDKVEAALRASTAELCEAIAEISPDRLGEMHMLPWGQEFSLGAIAGFHQWNVIYHVGQINFIQTLYGDKAMF